MIEKFFSMIRRSNKNDWQKVNYPPPISFKLFGFIPIRTILITSLILLESIITISISEKINSNIGQILIIIIFFYVVYKTIVYYKRFKRMRQEVNKNIEKRLQYLIHSLRLYDEEVDTENNKEKRIVRTIKIFYREDDKNGSMSILWTKI